MKHTELVLEECFDEDEALRKTMEGLLSDDDVAGVAAGGSFRRLTHPPTSTSLWWHPPLSIAVVDGASSNYYIDLIALSCTTNN
jgi:hypothetical protein